MKRFCISLFLLLASIFATTAQAQVTSLSITGFGPPLFLTPADGSFSASTNFDNGVSVFFFGPNHFFSLDFAAPNGQPLTVGAYPGATRFPFQAPTEPGLAVFGDGFGCNTLTGSFTVLEAVYDANGVVSFDATFEQFCDASIIPTSWRDTLQCASNGSRHSAKPYNRSAKPEREFHGHRYRCAIAPRGALGQRTAGRRNLRGQWRQHGHFQLDAVRQPGRKLLCDFPGRQSLRGHRRGRD